MSPQFCLSLYGSTDEIRSEITSNPEAALYEIRLDLSPELNLPQIRSATAKPLIFASHTRPELLASAASFADYLDVGPAPAPDARSIVSIHAAAGDPNALWSAYSGDHITKIVLETDDYYSIRKLLALNRRQPGRALCFAMGEAGAFSRILSVFEGAPWMYVSAETRPTAPGQFTLQELVHTYRLSRFSSKPAVFGILGNPVSHSRSPAFHNRRFAECGLPWVYVPLLCRDLRALFDCAADFGMIGFSVTHPHKEAILPLLDNVSPETRLLRSCNTVLRHKGRWVGTNTDVLGVRAMLQEVPLQNARMVILGAGGSARTIASVVRPHVRELVVLNRTLERAQQLASEYDAGAGTLEDLASLPYDILFQATPVGLRQGECPVRPEWLRPNAFVLDSIYEPAETALLQAARAVGCRVRNGEAWFVAQAEAQLQWWQNPAL